MLPEQEKVESWSFSFKLFLWWIINVSPAWIVIYTNSKVKPNPTRDIPKYSPFVRIDYKYWSYFVVSITEFFFFPRFIMGWIIWFVVVLIVILTTLGHKEGTPYKKW